MGISGFQKWTRKNFPDAVSQVEEGSFESFDHVCIDLNHVVHAAAHRSKDWENLARSLFSELNKLLKTCLPRRSVMLSMDGPAPIAKIATARKRREAAVKKGDKKGQMYLELTPGTST